MLLRALDYLLTPIMYLLQGNFSESPQETHPWHVKKFNWKNKGLLINGDDNFAKFGQSGISRYFGLFHMSIFGGLKSML